MMCLFLDFWDTQLRHLREVRTDGAVPALPHVHMSRKLKQPGFSCSSFCGVAHPGYDFVVLLMALDVAGCAAVAAWCTCRLPVDTLICYLRKCLACLKTRKPRSMCAWAGASTCQRAAGYAITESTRKQCPLGCMRHMQDVS